MHPVIRCVNVMVGVHRPIEVAVRRKPLVTRAGSREGDSNPRPAHYEQSDAQRCADPRRCFWHAARTGTETVELSAELARLVLSMLSTGVGSPVANQSLSLTSPRPLGPERMAGDVTLTHKRGPAR